MFSLTNSQNSNLPERSKAMIYLPSFTFPDERAEYEFMNPRDLSPYEIINDVRRNFDPRYHKGSFYPFKILTKNHLGRIDFESVTILCGGNGCGKTTVLNVIAEKLHLPRETLFNSGKFFSNYVDMCDHEELERAIPHGSRIIVSDDVFQHSMKQRTFNQYRSETEEDLSLRRKQLIDSGANLKSIEDFDRWSERREAIKSKSSYINKRIEKEKDEHSNGETAISYFLERMDTDGLYLLDEPENSLSIENQIALAQYIELSARYYNFQFIIASHSPIFLSIKGATIYDLDLDPVSRRKWTELEGVRMLFDFFEEHRDEFK